jgi:hypothetical protein
MIKREHNAFMMLASFTQDAPSIEKVVPDPEIGANSVPAPPT